MMFSMHGVQVRKLIRQAWSLIWIHHRMMVDLLTMLPMVSGFFFVFPLLICIVVTKGEENTSNGKLTGWWFDIISLLWRICNCNSSNSEAKARCCQSPRCRSGRLSTGKEATEICSLNLQENHSGSEIGGWWVQWVIWCNLCPWSLGRLLSSFSPFPIHLNTPYQLTLLTKPFNLRSQVLIHVNNWSSFPVHT